MTEAAEKCSNNAVVVLWPMFESQRVCVSLLSDATLCGRGKGREKVVLTRRKRTAERGQTSETPNLNTH